MGQRAQGNPRGHPGSPTHHGWPGRCWSLLGCSATVSFRRSRQTWLAGAFSSSSSLGGPGSGAARRTGWQRALHAAMPGTGTSSQPPTTCPSTGTQASDASPCRHQRTVSLRLGTHRKASLEHPSSPGTARTHLPATPAWTRLSPPPPRGLCCSCSDPSSSSSLDSSSA